MEKKTKNFALLLSLNAFIKLTALITLPLIVKTFTVTQFGVYALVQTLFMYFLVLSDLGIKSTGIRELNADIDDDKKQEIIRSIVSLRGWVVLFSVILMNVIGLILFRDAVSRRIVFLFSLGVLPFVLNLTWVHDAKQEMHIRTYYQFIERIIYIAVVAVGVLFRNLYIVAVGFFISYGIAGIIIVKLYYGFTYFKFRFFDKHQFEILSMSLPIGIAAVITPLYLTIDQFMIKFFMGNEAVGLYSGISRIIVAIVTFGFIVGTVLFPEIANLFFNNKINLLRKLVRKTVLIISCFYLIGYVLYFFIADQAIRLILSSDYVAMRPVMDILMVMVLVYFLNIIFAESLNAFRKQKFRLCSALAGLIVNVGLNLMFIPRYGFFGAAYATLFTQVMVFILNIVFYNHVLAVADNGNN